MKRLERQLCAALTAQLTAGGKVRVPEGGLMLWHAFCALSRTRRYHASGPEAISYGEIDSFCRLMRLPFGPDHVAIIVALDRVWLSLIQAREASRTQGTRTVPRVSETALSPALFDLVVG